MLGVSVQVARSWLRVAALRQHTPIAKMLLSPVVASKMEMYSGSLIPRAMAMGLATAAKERSDNPKAKKTATRSTTQKERNAIAKEQKKAKAAQRAAVAREKAKSKTQARHERVVARKKADAERKKLEREKTKEKARALLLKERERKKVEREKEVARAEKQRLAALRRPLVKRPKSTWQIFLQEFMAKHKSEHGKTNLPESARLAKVEFMSLSQADAERLQKLRDADKARYEEDIQKLLKTRGVDGILEENKRVRTLKKVRGISRSFLVRLPGLPKRPGNAYGFFLKDASTLFPEAKTMPIIERARFLGDRFRALSVDDRRKYDDSAKRALDQYTADKKKYFQEVTEKYGSDLTASP
ncbi:hypothetical protein V1525DRAFT_457363 [Lipomyces kononenkoae]|uniref:Uncharacterized protein n=1 Tax=Lipomyces kononenkoae TaxID=34357 RepID=A0ACC3SYN5_LIPKO